MQPALPQEPSDDDGTWLSADDGGLSAGEVGDFEQGSPFSRWALSRYLVGRAIGESVNRTLLLFALLLLAMAAGFEWGVHSTFLMVLAVIAAVVLLMMRATLRAVLRRLTAADRYGPIEARMRALVRDTHGDVLRELRRIHLPSHTITLPLLAVRIAGKRRPETIARLRTFEIERAVPKARLDELHMVLRDSLGRPGPTGPVNP